MTATPGDNPVAPEPNPDEQELTAAIMNAGQTILNAGFQATQVFTALIPTDNEPVVRIQFCTGSGVFVVCVDQAVARKIGYDLQEKGSRRKLAVIGGK